MSILQKVLTNENNINSNNLKHKNIFGEKNPNVFFNNEIKSVNLSQYYFTNFIDSKKSPLVNTLKNERRKILKNEIDYDQDYEIKAIEYRKNEKEKINEILVQSIQRSDVDYSLIFRLKYVFNPNIQFFFLDDKNGKYEVLFIDIYHLALPAADKSHKEKIANPKKTYEEHKLANYCLSNIFHK